MGEFVGKQLGVMELSPEELMPLLEGTEFLEGRCRLDCFMSVTDLPSLIKTAAGLRYRPLNELKPSYDFVKVLLYFDRLPRKDNVGLADDRYRELAEDLGLNVEAFLNMVRLKQLAALNSPNDTDELTPAEQQEVLKVQRWVQDLMHQHFPEFRTTLAQYHAFRRELSIVLGELLVGPSQPVVEAILPDSESLDVPGLDQSIQTLDLTAVHLDRVLKAAYVEMGTNGADVIKDEVQSAQAKIDGILARYFPDFDVSLAQYEAFSEALGLALTELLDS